MALTDMIRGRQTVLFLTNKSGGSVAAGDVVIVDTSNDAAFTTTTSGQSTSALGVVQESIANNATGRVCTAGYVPLVNVPASVTRGHFVETHTVAKQATGNATRRTGTFGRFLTGGTTPTAQLYGLVDTTAAAGSALASDTLWDAKGDAVYGTGADTASKLAVGSNGQIHQADSSQSTGWKNAWPPGYEFDYVEITTGGNVTATSDATANTIVTGNAVSYDGSTVIYVEFYSPFMTIGTTFVTVVLYDGSSSIGRLGITSSGRDPLFARRRLTPSNASHTYSVRAFVDAGTGTFNAGSGGASGYMPSYIRQVKA